MSEGTNPHRHRRLDLSRRGAACSIPTSCRSRRSLNMRRSQLGAIEINATFYGRQKPEELGRHGATVAPDGFQFAIKGSRFCVMRSKLADAGEGIGNFFAQGFAALGPKLGPDPVDVRRRGASSTATTSPAFHRPAARDARRHPAAPRDRAAPRELSRRERSSSFAAPATSPIVFEDSDEYPAASTPIPPTSPTRACSA